MNDFIADKLGEVLAFARVGKDTVTKGQKSLAELVATGDLEGLDDEFDSLESAVLEFATKEGKADEVEKQAKETAAKVTDMRDTYIGNKWSEDSEVLEWMGFYTGASLVHWYLLSGAAKELGLNDLEDITEDAISFYSAMFTSDEEVLKAIGAKQSSK